MWCYINLVYAHHVESIVMRLDDAVTRDINEVIHWVGFYVSSVKTLCMRFVGDYLLPTI